MNNSAQMDSSCLFCQIAAGHIAAQLVYQDHEFVAFNDIRPAAPVHFLLIPRLHIASMAQLEPQHAAMMARMLMLAPQLAWQQGCRPYPEGGFRLMCNTGADGGQEVHHLHWHIMGGARPWQRNN